LAALRPCFTAPGFVTFCALVCGMLASTGRRTVCGMLVGAGLSGSWSHDRAHKFFSTTRWSPQRLSILLAQLVVRLLVPADAVVSVVIDDTLFKRTGKKVWAAGWFHDGSVKGPKAGGRVRQQLGHPRDRGQPADAHPAGVPAGRRQTGPQGHHE